MYEKMKSLIIAKEYTIVEAQELLNSLVLNKQITPEEYNELSSLAASLPVTSEELDKELKTNELLKAIQDLTDELDKVKSFVGYTATPPLEQGTIDNPIPSSAGMQYYQDKYYLEDDKLYKCTRDTEFPIAYLPSQLIGHYFEEVQNEE